MRIAWALLLVGGCAGSPPGSNTGADKGPPPQPPAPQGPGANAFRAAIEANEAQFRLPGIITAHLNEEVRIGAIRVKPLAVLEDSRCSADVTCVWGGRVLLRVSISGAGQPVMELDHPIFVAGAGRLTLAAVAPLNWARPPAGVDPNEPKRFAFRLSRD